MTSPEEKGSGFQDLKSPQASVSLPPGQGGPMAPGSAGAVPTRSPGAGRESDTDGTPITPERPRRGPEGRVSACGPIADRHPSGSNRIAHGDYGQMNLDNASGNDCENQTRHRLGVNKEMKRPQEPAGRTCRAHRPRAPGARCWAALSPGVLARGRVTAGSPPIPLLPKPPRSGGASVHGRTAVGSGLRVQRAFS